MSFRLETVMLATFPSMLAQSVMSGTNTISSPLITAFKTIDSVERYGLIPGVMSVKASGFPFNKA